jgi:hypothetical protein
MELLALDDGDGGELSAIEAENQALERGTGSKQEAAIVRVNVVRTFWYPSCLKPTLWMETGLRAGMAMIVMK